MILEKALVNLEKNTGFKTEWKMSGPNQPGHGDAKIMFILNGNKKIARNAEIKKEIRKHHIAQLITRATERDSVILVAERLYPDIKRRLNEAGIDWLDVAGNIHLKEKDTLIWIDRHSTTPAQKKKNRAFTKTGLKVVFLFLHDEIWLNKTYREIAKETDVALGTIKHVIDGLKEHNFILSKSKTTFKLINKDRLLDQWITAFTDELKPSIQKGRYRFMDIDTEQNWQNMELTPGTVWSGEPAADLINQNLKPNEYILYTQMNRADLMKTYTLIPDDQGNVEVREPYWSVKYESRKIAPILTVYTDLMETGDPRNVKAAKTIYEKTAQN